jgi:Bacteriophage head to tail connecting protein
LGKLTLRQEIENETKRRKLLILRSQLEIERSTFLPQWRDLAHNCQARRARFAVSDVNRGDRRNNNIINNTAITCHRTLRAGMMAGMTSPARPWFKMVPSNLALLDNAAVKKWLSDVTDIMLDTFTESNLYNVLPIIYGDMGWFATAAMLMEEDFDDVVRFYAFPIGSYMIATDEKGRVNTFVRDFRMTVKQLVQKFGREGRDPNDPQDIDWDKLSVSVKNYWENNQREQWVDVVHMILPNDLFGEDRRAAQDKKFQSVYFERGAQGGQLYDYTGPEDDRFLRIKGYDWFPVLCPRWEVSAEDAYGTSCPGMDALGDIKGLQMLEKRKLQAVDKIVNPPMQAPTSMRNAKASILPGDISYVDVREGNLGFRPVYEPKLSISEVQEAISEHQKRIESACFTDLFLMFANDDQAQPDTATEVNEKKQEKLLALGPVLEQTNQDLLDPLVENTFKILLRQRKIPPPPPEIHGQKLNVEYLSIMAQAQKSAGLGGIDRFMQGIGAQAELFPEIKDKVDIDAYVDTYGDNTSVPPQLIRTDDKVKAIRDQRAKQAQQQQQNENLQAKASAAKDAAGASMDGNSLLTNLMDQSKAGQVVPN